MMRWQARDLAVLRWIGEQNAIHLEHLALLLGRTRAAPTKTPGALGSETVRKLVQRWKRAGLVESAWFVHNQPSWVWLTRKGLDQMDLDFRSWEPKVQGLSHLAAINQARLWVEEHQSAAVWRSERQLNRQRAFTRTQDQLDHRPDAEVLLGTLTNAIEVERSAKTPQRLPAILYGLARRYNGIWYFCSPATEAAMQRAIAQLDLAVQRKFALVRLEEARAGTAVHLHRPPHHHERSP